MTSLPRALAPWAPELAAFPTDVALALGQLASRLAVALGPMSRETSSQAGQPDGFDGVTRRGTYGHLLPSEWALADAVPDEFLRRASAGELSFLHIRRREPAAAHVALALFDAGPSQIGGPRIVQLAALVALSQRARASRARFRWGIAQRPEDGWAEDVTAAAVMRMLAARTGAAARTEDLYEWVSAMVRAGMAGEVWLVGDASLAALAPELRPAVVAIEDPLEAGVRAIAITCRRFRSPDARLSLELPTGPLCARLLRDPFETARAIPLQSPLGQSPRLALSFGARKVIVKRADGGLSLVAVPNSPRAASSPVTDFRPPEGETPIATDWHAGRWRILTQREGSFVLHTVAKGGGHVVPPLIAETALPFPTPDVIVGIASLVRRRDGGECFVHPSGVGVELRGGRAHVVGTAKAVTRVGWDILWVREGGPGGRWLERNGDRRVLDASGDGKAFFGWQGATTNDWLLAVRVQSSHWKVYSEKTSRTLAPPAQVEVLGVTEGPALLLREPDQRSLTLLGPNVNDKLPALADSLAEACACASAPYVAYSSQAGELIVYSLQRQATVLHVLPDMRRSS